MSLILNKNNQAEGFHVGSQTPIDDRVIFTDIADLINLGASDAYAYKYYEGMRVWVMSVEKEYVWKESAVGELATSFSYPAGLTVNGVLYGGRDFNFVETRIISLSTGITYTSSTVNLTATVQHTESIPTAITIIGVFVYDSSDIDITDGLEVIVTGTDIKVTSNTDLTGLSIKAVYTT